MGNPTVAERLILEITESSAMLVPELVVSFMAELQARGISFASTISARATPRFRHFKEFSFDILKIDGQFIRGIARDADNQVLTRAMISIAQQFDMFTVAELVERAEDAACLADYRDRLPAGLLFRRPHCRAALGNAASRASDLTPALTPRQSWTPCRSHGSYL